MGLDSDWHYKYYLHFRPQSLHNKLGMLICFILFLWTLFSIFLVFSPIQFSSVLSLSCVWLFATPWITACQASLSITSSWSSLKLMFMESVMPSHPLSSPSPPAPSPSQHQGLSWRVNSSHEVAKVLELQLQHQFFQWTPRTDLL